jgi:ABC-type polysaccharide/polyol phosphate export permease
MDAITHIGRFVETSCLPARIYFFVVILNLVVSIVVFYRRPIEFHLAMIAIVLIFGIAVTWVSNFMCAQGFELVSWLILVLPAASFIAAVRRGKR